MTLAEGRARCVVVGASLAGLRAAEALCRAGWPGEVALIGDEQERPYNRPPLSKSAMSTEDIEWLRPGRALKEATWHLGDGAAAVDLTEQVVTTAGGAHFEFDGLVVATGLRPRALSIPGPVGGRFVLRALTHASVLRDALADARSVVVVGAGFIGCELAATVAALGLPVHVVAPEEIPLEQAVGADLGSEIRRRLDDLGVRFHLGTVPERYLGADSVERVVLADGTDLAADVVVEAAGSVPNVDWLEGNGLDLSDGLACDNALRVEGRNRIVAAGDVARFPNHRYDTLPRRVEHWTVAVDTGKHAGRSLAAQLVPDAAAVDEFAPLPTFWSELGTTRLQSFGAPGLGLGDVRLVEGELTGEAALTYHDERGTLTGVVLLGLPGRYTHYRELASAPAAETIG